MYCIVDFYSSLFFRSIPKQFRTPHSLPCLFIMSVCLKINLFVCLIFGHFGTISPCFCCTFVDNFLIPIRFFFYLMFRFLLDLLRFACPSGSLSVVSTSWFYPSGHSHNSSTSVETHHWPLTILNNKNRCPTSTGTGTLRRQPSMFHPLNPLKSVPPLGHLFHKNDYFSH